ncbi:leiomodin-2a [Mugil cephalus]|uniref:leiomodin-2a n=1 Tax=Mugil cephalus TaxID=48193 RepID=UPI001FB5BCC7|nr:leiomodin-2a [Mugil cephalus]
MSTFGYCRELKKYDEVNEDELLAKLSKEELQELERELADLDPDNNIPVGLRQKDQTAKIPSDSFDREALLKYWENENKVLLEVKKMESNPRQERQPDKSRGVVTTSDCNAVDSHKRKISQKGKKAGKNVSDINGAKEDKGKRNDQNRKEALMGSKCPQKKGLSKDLKIDSMKSESTGQSPDVISERPSGNPIVIDQALEQILNNDPAMTEVNLNNIEDISQETLLRFAKALCTNTHVHVFSLANTHADDQVAFAISKMLCENCSIRNLNIESNFVSGQGILALLASLKHNTTLVELRFHNQRHICGGKVEMEMVQLLRENTTLLKLGYQFDLPGPRMTATGILTRNQDHQRQRRLQQKKEQSPSPGSGQVSDSLAKTKQPKKSCQVHHNVENQPKKSQPTRKTAEMVQQHEGPNSIKTALSQRKPKSKKLKNGANENESAEILKDLKDALKPPLKTRRDEPCRLPPRQRSSRDDLMAAIRGSSISSLKRVDLAQT